MVLSFRPAANRRIVPSTMSRFRHTVANPLITQRATGSTSEDPDEVTKKYGLEAGMVNALTNGDDKQKVKPKDLLAKYGIAYLATSIALAIISYGLCYVLISNGVDVAAVLERVGIRSTGAASNAGTAALAYAVHKAASPIRFPPTVALTPIVAGWLGRKPAGSDSKKDQSAKPLN